MSNTVNASIPSSTSSKDLLDDFVIGRIDFRARMMAKTLGLSDEERDDLRQDMTVEVLKAARRFDSAQATWHTFVCRVLGRFAKQYRRDEGVRRKHETLQPIGDAAADGDTAVSAFEAIPDEHDDIGDLERRLDTETVLASLPPRLRRICELLKDKSPAEVAAELGIHPRSIYRLMASARRHFEAAGLDF
jgi:RNA polymerase sigma-70 factor, ECF subfamily